MQRFEWKEILLMSVLVPLALVWDIVYTIISWIYKGATWIDQNGGAYVDKVMNR